MERQSMKHASRRLVAPDLQPKPRARIAWPTFAELPLTRDDRTWSLDDLCRLALIPTDDPTLRAAAIDPVLSLFAEWRATHKASNAIALQIEAAEEAFKELHGRPAHIGQSQVNCWLAGDLYGDLRDRIMAAVNDADRIWGDARTAA